MSGQLKYLSRIQNNFDAVICGVNGVLTRGVKINETAVETLIKLYQDGKKVFLASNSGLRVNDLYLFLKRQGVPMNIFSAMITAGEICHFYLKNNSDLGHSYYILSDNPSYALVGVDNYRSVDNVVLADFILAESGMSGINLDKKTAIMQQAVSLNLPFVCVGNNTLTVEEKRVSADVGALAEQYAMMGGKIIPFGKPDVRIANYLTESLYGISYARCLIIGDCMATDMRLGNTCKAQTLLITDGVHQIKKDIAQGVEELSQSYGLNVDYFMEQLQW